MPIRLLVSFDQSTMLDDFGPSADGVCYYLCNYVEEKVWFCPMNYEAARAAAINGIRYRRSLINYAKAQNIRNDRQQNYGMNMPSFFVYDRIYRVALQVVRTLQRPQPFRQNHEMIICTGEYNSQTNSCKLLFFEPNFGLYEIIAHGRHIMRSRFENYVDALYRQNGSSAVNFTYRNVRSISDRGPLSFR